MVKKVLKSLLKKREKRKLKREFKAKLNFWKNEIIIRDKVTCQKCNKELSKQMKHVHHIISLQAVKRKYPDLLEDLKNGILLCASCHKFAPDSPHQGSMEFILWFELYKPTQYNYLKEFLLKKNTNFLSAFSS